MQKERMVWQ